MEKTNKQLLIGEVGVIDGVKVECVKTDPFACYRCAFRHFKSDEGNWCCDVHKCLEFDRTDHTDVYFKKIEE